MRMKHHTRKILFALFLMMATTIEAMAEAGVKEAAEEKLFLLLISITAIICIAAFVLGLIIGRKTSLKQKREATTSFPDEATATSNLTTADKFLLAKREKEIEELNKRILSLKNELAHSVNEYNDTLTKKLQDLQQDNKELLKEKDKKNSDLARLLDEKEKILDRLSDKLGDFHCAAEALQDDFEEAIEELGFYKVTSRDKEMKELFDEIKSYEEDRYKLFAENRSINKEIANYKARN